MLFHGGRALYAYERDELLDGFGDDTWGVPSAGDVANRAVKRARSLDSNVATAKAAAAQAAALPTGLPGIKPGARPRPKPGGEPEAQAPAVVDTPTNLKPVNWKVVVGVAGVLLAAVAAAFVLKRKGAVATA